MKNHPFIEALIQLMRTYDVELKARDEYDGADEHCGTVYSFSCYSHGSIPELDADMSDVLHAYKRSLIP